MSDKAEPKRGKKYRALKLQEIAERRAAVAQKYKEGLTMERIAQALDCDAATICRDVHALTVEWGRTAGISIAAHIAIQLEKIENLEREAWDAFRKSEGVQRATSARKVLTPIKDRDGITQNVESTVTTATEFFPTTGDPRFLVIVCHCVSQRMKLLGLANRGGGRLDEELKSNQPTTLTDFVAAHLAEQETKPNSLTKAARMAAPRDSKPLPLP